MCLSYSWYVRSTGLPTSQEYDKLSIELRDVYGNGYELHRLSNVSPCETWQTTTLDVSGYSGQSWTLSLASAVEFSYPTSFFIDDMTLGVCGF
jgi:hypothetical protein